jgi:starch synthase
MKILYAAAEISPFAKMTNTADLMRFLPASLQDKGFEIRILLPKYGSIHDRRNRLHEVIRLSGIEVKVADNVESMRIKVASIPNAKLQVYFLDNDTYYKRKGLFRDAKGNFYEDNAERLIFYNKGILETVIKLGWKPDFIHCHDWAAGFVPVFMKETYKDQEIFKNTKIIYNLHSPVNEGIFDEGFIDLARLPEGFDKSRVMTDGKVDFIRAGLSYADHVVTSNDIRGEFDDLFKELNITPTKIQGSPFDMSSKFADYYNSLAPVND